MKLILDHLQNSWTQHAAAGSAFLASLNGEGMLQSIIVGVAVFALTNGVKLLVLKVIELVKKSCCSKD